MGDEITSFLFLFSRYLHVVAASLLLGGTLFYELIVPVAIDELKNEQKLAVFARARWAFRWIVWCSVIMLLTSGVISTYRNWYAYSGGERQVVSGEGLSAVPAHGGMRIEGAGYWWLAHAGGALLGAGIALALVIGGTPPRYPLLWMRINLLILLVVIFLASTTRHMRLRVVESHLPPAGAAVE